MNYTGSNPSPYGAGSSQPAYAAASAPEAVPADAQPAGSIPADFDADAFVRNAKVNFIRLQAANDARNLDDIREYTTPEMFAEIKMNWMEQGSGTQKTDVVSLNAEVLDVTEEAARYIVSVRFTGLVREEAGAEPQPFDEVWHLVRPQDESRAWAIAGIQQSQ